MKLEDIKEGDYVIYTEMPYSNYADSLKKIIKKDGELYSLWIVTRWKDGFVKNESNELEYNAIPVYKFFDPNCWFPCNYSKEDDPVEFMKSHLNRIINQDLISRKAVVDMLSNFAWKESYGPENMYERLVHPKNMQDEMIEAIKQLPSGEGE